MRRHCLIGLLLLTAAPAWADDAATAEQKKMSGTWKVKDGQADGQPLPAEVRDKARIVFKGDTFAFTAAGMDKATTYAVDPAKGTITIDPPKGETKTLRGLYKLDGDTLTLCVTDGDKIPVKLAAAADVLYLVLEREKK